MTAIEAYILARAYTRQAIEGAGALKGAPCQIQSIEAITGGNRITFAWETGEGETETDTLDVMDGADGDDGVGIASIMYKETDAQGNNIYTVTLTSGSTYDITCPKGAQGETGATGATGNGIVSIAKTSTEGLVDTYTITYTNGNASAFTVTNGATPTVDSEMSESSENPLQNKIITAWTSADTKSVTGNPITITDAAAVKAKALSVSIEPVQDLHGYDKPWVGGAGKNKMPITLDGIKSLNNTGTWSGNVYTVNNGTITVNTDDGGNVTSIKVNGTFNAATYFNVARSKYEDGTAYVFNGAPSGGAYGKYYFVLGTGSTTVVDFGSGVNFTAGTGTYTAYITVDNGFEAQNLMFYPMIRLATETDATFAPYTNICPISGHTEASVQRDGKNLWRGKFVNSNFVEYSTYNDGPSYAKAVYAGSDYMQVFPGQTYRYSVDGTAMEMRYMVIDNDGNTVVPYTTSYYITIPNNGTRMQWRSIDDVGSQDVKAQLEIGETATPYTPYVSQQTYTIALGDTIYGGTVDFDSGVMTVDRALVALDSLNWEIRDDHVIRSAISQAAEFVAQNVKVDAICSCYYVSDQYHSADYKPCIAFNTATQVYLYDDAHTFTTKEDAQQYLTGATLCYKLATPFTIQLTPQQIQLLKGTNTLTTNGTNITLTYQPDNLVGAVMEQVEPQIEDLQGQIDEIELPSNPSADGSNLLRATTVSGETTKSWVSESLFMTAQGNKTVDCNTETSNAMIRVRDTSTNMPTGAVDGVLIVFKPSTDNVCVQIFVESSGKMSERINWYGTWSTWKTIVS